MSIISNENDRIYCGGSYYEKGCISLIEHRKRKSVIKVFIEIRNNYDNTCIYKSIYTGTRY